MIRRSLSEHDREILKRREYYIQQLRDRKLELENEIEEIEQDIADNEKWNRELLEDVPFMDFEESQGYQYFMSRGD